MQNGFVETLIGAAVIIVAVGFFYYGYNTTGSGAVAGYEIVARFDRVDGISAGTDVKMSGIKIGTVTSQELDQKAYHRLSNNIATTSSCRKTRRSKSQWAYWAALISR
jgi:phospholipid/cholesterol/gamma-HCH transport system substrate-binding protein